MKKVFTAASVLLVSMASLAEACSRDEQVALLEELSDYVEANPEVEAKLEGYALEVEEHYGGEPNDEQLCDALTMLMDKAKAGQ